MAEREHDSTAARLVDGLLDGAEHVEDGHFTLDAAAAAAKHERFTYADRSVFLVPLVEALLGLGARAIALDAGLASVRVRARDVTLVHADVSLRELFVRRHGDEHAPLRRLAVALDMALGAGPDASARLRYGAGSTTILAEIDGERTPTLREPDDDALPASSLAIDLRGLAIAPDAAFAVLRPAVEHVAVPITIADEPVSGYARQWWASETAAAPGYRVRVGLVERGEPDSVIELWAGGLCAERLPAPAKLIEAVVELDAPRRDLGQIAIVRDETLDAALAAVEAARAALLARLEAEDRGWDGLRRPPEWPARRVALALGHPLPEGEPREQIGQPLTTMQLFWNLRLHDGLPGTGATTWIASFLIVAAFVMLMPLAVGLLGLDLELVGVSLLVIAMLLALASLVSLPVLLAVRRVRRVRDDGVRTRARITQLELLERSRVTNVVTHARIHWRFEDDQGLARSGVSARLERKLAERWHVGEQIYVFYAPDAPEVSWWEAEIGPRPRRPSQPG